VTEPAGRLRVLDDRWLPRAARSLHGLGERLRGRDNGRRRLATQRVVEAAGEEPALAGSLGAVFVAAVLIAAAGGDRTGDGRSDPALLPPPPPALVATLGPAPGASVVTYLTRANYDLRHLGAIAAGRPAYAIVDLRAYEVPARATELFSGAKVVRAYVRVPSSLPTEVRSVPITGLGKLAGGIRLAAQVATATAKSYAALLKSFHPKSRSDRVTRARYAEQRRASLLEASRLEKPATCRCVFAMLVLGDIDRLSALARVPGVRVVDPASPVIPLSGLTVRPLEPQVTTVVPRAGLLGG
jgi:hypothetical protein